MGDTKAWWQSKTVLSAIMSLVGLLVALLSTHLGWGAETEAMIVSAISSVLAAIFRVTAAKQVVNPNNMIVLLFLSVLLVGGCTRYVKGDALKMDVKKGPPCTIKVWMDGDLIQESEAKQPCKVNIDGQ